MSEFVRIGTVAELPNEGEAKEFIVGNLQVCVAKINGQFHAIDNVCPHRGGPLGQGIIEGTTVVCPWHGWEFEASTGKNPFSPSICVPAYDLMVENDDVLVRLRES